MSDEAVPDIEVARYALRTFDIVPLGENGRLRLKSLYQVHFWEGGKAIATCLNRDRVHVERNGTMAWSNHAPPVEGCSCGLYGTLTLDQLLREYGNRARNLICVIAAEGGTVIGSKGLRTAAARIVAYWTPVRATELVMERECKDAKAYTNVTQMLSDYKFPPFEGEWLDPGVIARWRAGKSDIGGALPGYTPGMHVAGGLYQATVLGYTTSRNTSPPTKKITAVPWGNQSTWDALTPMLTAATDKGREAVRHALGLPPLTPPKAGP